MPARVLLAVVLLVWVMAAPLAARSKALPSSPDGFDGRAPDRSSVFAPATPDWQALETRIEARRAEQSSERRSESVKALGDPWEVTNLNTGQGYETLEEAVTAAASGHTLRIEEALLEVGRITIDKDLVLEGSDGDEVLLATEATGSAGDDRAWFLVDTGVQLEVRDLSFDGNGFAIHQAFRHKGSGSFQRTSFRDIQFEPLGPTFAGTAIVAFGGKVDVLDSSFEQIGRVGVLYFGDVADTSLAAGNTYLGKGDGAFLDYAIEVGAGASVAIWNNRVRDCRGVVTTEGGASSAQSAALLATTFFAPGTEALIRENDLEANGIGIAVGFDATDAATVSASFNRIIDSQVVGVRHESTVPMAAERNWWGCNAGLGNPGCETANDGAGSVDSDPWLVLTTVAIGPYMPTGASTLIGADLTWDSDGVRSRIEGAVPDGFEATFAGGLLGLGTVSPLSSQATGGRAPSAYAAGLVPGMDQISSTVDGETHTIDLLLEEALFFDGFESADTMAWSSTSPSPGS